MRREPFTAELIDFKFHFLLNFKAYFKRSSYTLFCLDHSRLKK